MTTMTTLRSLAFLLLLAFAAASDDGFNKQSKKFLAKKKKDKAVHTLSSGMKYKELVGGEGESPEPDIVCAVHYSTSFLNGTVFESSYDKEKPLYLAPVQASDGWGELLQLMKQGSKWELYVPIPDAAAQQLDMEEGTLLIYTLELIEISNFRATIKGPNKEGHEFLEAKKIEKGVKTFETSDLMYKEVVAGTGEFPDVDRVLKIHYVATFINGTKFFSTHDSGEHLQMAPNEVMKGLREALVNMKEGAEWEIYIPPDMGYSDRLGGKKIPPGTVLIYTFHLAEILELRSERSGLSPEDDEFLNDMKADPEVVEMASGLLIKEIVAGDGERPSFDSPCVFHYNSSLANGTALTSTYEQGEPFQTSPNEIMLRGVREALQLMKVGGKLEAYIPPELGYGEGIEGVLHEGAVLIYSLELIEVLEVEALSEGATLDGVSIEGAEFLAQKEEEKGVIKLDSGLMYKEITAGTGRSPLKTERCRIHYLGQFIDGKEFDSSYDRGEPLIITPQETIPGWIEALQLMKEGGKWKLYIPPGLAYGERGASGIIPGGTVLSFTVTLLDVLDGDKDEL